MFYCCITGLLVSYVQHVMMYFALICVVESGVHSVA